MTDTNMPTIELSVPVNLRDLGGIPIEGGLLREGFVIRTDDLSITTAEAAGDLVDQGLRSIIDLRSALEIAVTGRGPFGDQSSVNYHHVPIHADMEQTLAEAFDQASYGKVYERMMEDSAGQIVTALAIIAHAPGAVAFHCAAGQDRTGVLAAALLLALGAEREDIVADYVRTGENTAAILERIAPVVNPLMAKYGHELEDVVRAAIRAEFSDLPMRELLEGLNQRYSDPLAPLRAAGLSDELIARLRERALTA